MLTVLRKIQHVNYLAQSLVTIPQQIMIKFQRKALVEQFDDTTDSDRISDFYEPGQDQEIKH